MIIKKEDGTIVDVVEIAVDTTMLDVKIAAADYSINNTMKIKTEPDKETLEFWNSFAEQVQANANKATVTKTALEEEKATIEKAVVSTVDIKPVIKP